MKRRTDLDQPKLRGTARQLPKHEVGELVAGYQAGATVYELAKQFKIHAGTRCSDSEAVGTESMIVL